jgi:hypothetical protein
MGLKKSFKRVLEYFNGDYEKTLIWFATKNAGLGDTAPLVMISVGRTEKLCQFINAQLDGNRP